MALGTPETPRLDTKLEKFVLLIALPGIFSPSAQSIADVLSFLLHSFLALG